MFISTMIPTWVPDSLSANQPRIVAAANHCFAWNNCGLRVKIIKESQNIFRSFTCTFKIPIQDQPPEKRSKSNIKVLGKIAFTTSSVIFQCYFAGSGTQEESFQVTSGILQRVKPQVLLCILGRHRRIPQSYCQTRKRMAPLKPHELSV